MDVAFMVGRIILGGYFLSAGLNHFKGLRMMAGYAKSKGTPAPELAVGGTGAMLILGGLSILLGAYPVAGIVLLVIFLAGASVGMHDFWKAKDAQTRMAELVNFTKNLGLLGALLMLLAIPRPWIWSLAR